jgi:hypothetical protein
MFTVGQVITALQDYPLDTPLEFEWEPLVGVDSTFILEMFIATTAGELINELKRCPAETQLTWGVSIEYHHETDQLDLFAVK